MKVLFVVRKLDFADHIAIPHLSAMARALGWNRYFCDFSRDKLEPLVADLRPDVIAYSANVDGWSELAAANKRLRERHRFVAIMGGPYPTFYPESFASSGMDAYCVGEGDLAFHTFLERVTNGDDWSTIPNLLTARGRNPVANLIDPLDDLPPADRDITLSGTFLAQTAKKTFYATRGCPYSCSYCANSRYNLLYRGKGRVVRRFSPRRIVDEMLRVRRAYRMEYAKFGDDLVAARADPWFEDLMGRYQRDIGLPFNCYLRLDLVTPELVALLVRGGCHSVHLSIDSLSEHVREDILHRRGKHVDFGEKLAILHKARINTWVNFMLAAPGATQADDLATIPFARRHRITYAHYSTTVPMYGTPLYDYAVAHGLCDPKTHASDMHGCNAPSTLGCFSRRDRRVRYNILLLGPLAAALPRPLGSLLELAIRKLAPNRLFKWLHDRWEKWNLERRIFKLR